jgi:phage gpG-like protein
LLISKIIRIFGEFIVRSTKYREPMKFTKTQAIEEIKAKIGKNDLMLSDRSLDEILESLIPVLTTEETELDAFVTSTLPVFRTANGNLRKEVSEKIKQITTTPAHVTQKDEDPTKVITELLSKQLEPLLGKIAAIEDERAIEKIKKEARSKFLSKRPDERWKKAYEKAIERGTRFVTKDSDPEEIAKAIEADYNDTLSLIGNVEGYTPVETKGGGGGGENKALKEAAEFLEAEGFIPKKE